MTRRFRAPAVGRSRSGDDAAATARAPQPVPPPVPGAPPEPDPLLEPEGGGEERIIRLDEERFICARLEGPPDGPPLVLITGLGFDLTTWPLSFVRGLTRHGHRVIRLDNRDEGRSFRASSAPPTARQLLSGTLPEGQYTVEDMSQDVADALRELGVQRADVMGFSLGGMIAQSLAGQPGRGAAVDLPVLHHG
ncbi:alpha/beta fold hydrolase [Kocuria tytonis]|uniref:alpha/beta fold hydrolase n=1 Tax=Kocuria tytonis TaxID=2054280 RepID=UPI001F23057A|nr:alpha/beta fold hydrolase [Kocuria tytonis]